MNRDLFSISTDLNRHMFESIFNRLTVNCYIPNFYKIWDKSKWLSVVITSLTQMKSIDLQLIITLNIPLKGSYDAFLKIIILCIWCNRICWHALMFKKHIIFQILYIIVGPLCPAFLKRFIFYKVPPSDKRSLTHWPTDPVHCDWPNTASTEM